MLFFLGESLKKLTQDRGITAEDITIKSKLANCNEECIITDEIIHSLAEALGLSLYFWMALQQVCDERNERKKGE